VKNLLNVFIVKGSIISSISLCSETLERPASSGECSKSWYYFVMLGWMYYGWSSSRLNGHTVSTKCVPYQLQQNSSSCWNGCEYAQAWCWLVI